MNKEIRKFYCFADESGQDTNGKLFLVCVVLKSKDQLESLRKKLEQSELSSGKKLSKWLKTAFAAKEAYLLALLEIKELEKTIYYSTYNNSKEYYPLISLTIAKSLAFQQAGKYEANITIDGLNAKETEKVRSELKNLRVRYKKIRGLRDEQEILLRLADGMVGFLRDCLEGHKYTKKLLPKLIKAKIVVKV